MRLIKTVSFIAVVGTATLLGGCATRESAEHAQASADLADSDAKAAHGAADRAQATADGATKTAQDATVLAQSANDKVDRLIADMQKRREAALHHRHHRRHVASNASNTCPPLQQKSELKKPKREAALQFGKAPDKTASN